jgi:hypothetical protein
MRLTITHLGNFPAAGSSLGHVPAAREAQPPQLLSTYEFQWAYPPGRESMTSGGVLTCKGNNKRVSALACHLTSLLTLAEWSSITLGALITGACLNRIRS